MSTRAMPNTMKFVIGSPLLKWSQQAVIWLYRTSGGRVAGRISGQGVLLLTTRGRKSGKPRTVPLMFLKERTECVVIASKGGFADHPLWYKNLIADPDVHVQIGRRVRSMRARTATAAERERLWPRVVACHRAYGDYQSWTDREIPLVVLSEVCGPSEPAASRQHGALS